MNTAIYQPFKSFDFKNQLCFLSGESPVEPSRVLPEWLIKMANLTGDEQIKLLDESIRTYQSLTVPTSPQVYANFISPLENKIAAAFEKGYAGLANLEDVDLFNWIGKLMYSFLYIEMQGAIRLNQLSGDGMNMSQGLMHKFGNLHTMLQGIYKPVVFEEFTPWSIIIVPLAETNTAFSFRDEINTLTFSLKFKDFGIIACLQDNGTNKRYHHEILESINDTKLSEQQFEEIAARFFYSAYLFNRLPEYNIMPAHGTIYIDAMPLKGTQNKALFDVWAHKTYAQVLENFWKPWGHTLFEIIKDPSAPLSYFNDPHLPTHLRFLENEG
ncbi:hypothetical protein [Pedobacter insulae]|uniref:Uncharacterized protein n=1 Tax=Pedobacter insulae TaxID=414048 RepID=A0A1I2XKK8_9SPHI|nr:hypothetical protein [Pedobacter insulae]SFH13617.1 hypothetical protein SAMN04489864_105287 [Pedobacter insulae]